MDEAALPGGRWAVGVSGGADSVALLLLACGRPGLTVHVAHLNHQTRGSDSDADATFVADLARRLGVGATIAKRSDVEVGPVLANRSARYRQARLKLFRRVVEGQGLDGVLLAHHAADQAETVLLRLLRGGGPRSLGGMVPRAVLGGMTLARPLLSAGPGELRRFLVGRGQPWREDASNGSEQYLRNRVRPLAGGPGTRWALVGLATAAQGVTAWLDENAPQLGESFATAALHGVPEPLARHAAGRWLVGRGVPADAVGRAVCDRLVTMATDAATPPRQTFPGGVPVGRRGGSIGVGSQTKR